jgi:hypothetical protein
MYQIPELQNWRSDRRIADQTRRRRHNRHRLRQ